MPHEMCSSCGGAGSYVGSESVRDYSGGPMWRDVPARKTCEVCLGTGRIAVRDPLPSASTRQPAQTPMSAPGRRGWIRPLSAFKEDRGLFPWVDEWVAGIRPKWFVLLGLLGGIAGYTSAAGNPLEQLLTAAAGAGAGLLLIPIAAAAFKLVLILGLFGAVAYLVYLLAS